VFYCVTRTYSCKFTVREWILPNRTIVDAAVIKAWWRIFRTSS